MESVTELNFKYTMLTIRYKATLQIVHRHPVPKLNKLQLYTFCTCSLLVIRIAVLQLPFHSMWVLTRVLSAIQVQASVHERPTFAQEQLLLPSFFLQVHVVRSNRLVGAGSLDISFGVSSSSSFCHPRPSGDGRSSKASRLFLQMCVW